MRQLADCTNRFQGFSALAVAFASESKDYAFEPVSPSQALISYWLTAIQNVALRILKLETPRSKKTLIVLILAFSQLIVTASASTYYISASGGSDSNTGTSAAPWATFAHAWTGMSSGDTLIVKNGTYSAWLNPPSRLSGTAGAYTTVQAETPWGVTVDGSTVTPAYKATLYLYAMSYFQVYGIKFASGPSLTGGQEPIVVNSSNHIKLQKLAGYNAPCNNNTSVFDVSSSSYVLVEDSHAWGCGRYKFLAYQSQKVIFRHNVARHDSAEVSGGVIGTWGRQCAQYTMYDSTDILEQNNISVDSGEADGSTGNLYGGIWSENNAAVDNSGKYEGDIFINLKTGTGSCCLNGASINDPKLIGTREISNVAIINSTSGFWGDRQDGTSLPASLLLHHMTLVNIAGIYQGSGNSADGIGAAEMNNSNFTTKILKDSILQHNNTFGIAQYMASDQNIYFNNTANFGTVTYQGPVPVAGANDRLNVDPMLKYPVRVEAGTPGSGTASDGGDIGATILYRIGTPGTLYGDAGYDSLTSISLWPWDDEAVIKADMASYTGQGASGTRGFAAPGNGLYGGPITLTSYIWESLGYPCPADVCTAGTGAAPSVSVPTFSPVAGTYNSAQSVTISSATPSATIYYTIDGTTPTTSSTVYSGPIAVSSSQTIKAIATASNLSNSSLAAATYIISVGATSQAASPTFTPAAGTYSSAQSVTIASATPTATIYYTTDGTTPTTSSTVYSGPITVSTTETLKAIAAASGFSNSAVAVAAYTINSPGAAFAVSSSPTSLTVTSAQPGTATISVVPVNGFNGAVSLACKGLPAGVSCIFSQPSVNVANAPVSATLTVYRTGTTARLIRSRNSDPLFPGSALAVAFCCISWKRRRRLQMLLLLVVGVTGLTMLNGCGGATFVTNASPTAVVSPLTVTGTSGTLQYSAIITVTMK